MLASVTFDDLSRWVRGEGLEIILLVTGGILLARLVTWVSERTTVRIDREAVGDPTGSLVRSERSKHLHAVAQVVRWVTVVLVYFFVALLVLRRLNVPVGGLVAPAAVLGVALGFGAQRLVQDILSGFFLIMERQYGFGDLIRIAQPGDTKGVTGTVEDLTLRTTRMRTVNGELLIIPNGEIRQVTNLSKDWARAVIDVPIPAGEDVSMVSDVLREVGHEAFADQAMQPLLFDAPSVIGVEKIDVGFFTVRVVARTLPGKQFEVGRELRSRVTQALREHGVDMTQTMLSTAQAGA